MLQLVTKSSMRAWYWCGTTLDSDAEQMVKANQSQMSTGKAWSTLHLLAHLKSDHTSIYVKAMDVSTRF